jgi:hypothetical protein
MNSPQNNIWGPALWNILHFSAERIGSRLHLRLPQEETRIWTGLLGSLRYSIPCPLCKKHYTQFFLSNPINSMTKDTIRLWLFLLHSSINIRNDKPNTITIDELPAMYDKPFNFTYNFNNLNEHMTYAIRLGWSTRNDTQRTIRFLQELKRFYDFF